VLVKREQTVAALPPALGGLDRSEEPRHHAMVRFEGEPLAGSKVPSEDPAGRWATAGVPHVNDEGLTPHRRYGAVPPGSPSRVGRLVMPHSAPPHSDGARVRHVRALRTATTGPIGRDDWVPRMPGPGVPPGPHERRPVDWLSHGKGWPSKPLMGDVMRHDSLPRTGLGRRVSRLRRAPSPPARAQHARPT
jgi:hypothetical protein